MLRTRNFLIFCLILNFASAPAWAKRVVVREGDTLSNIIWRELGSPIYGKRGNLQRFIARNTWLKNPNFLSVGLVLELEEKVASNNRTLASEPVVVPVSSVSSPAPTPVSLPAASELPVHTPSPSFEGYSEFSFATDFQFSSLHVVDTGGATATFLSDSNFGVDLAWLHHLSARWDVGLTGGLRSISFLQPKTIATLSHADVTNHSFGIDVRMHPSKNVVLNAGVGYAQELSLSFVDLSTISVDQVLSPKVKAEAGFRIPTTERLSVEMAASGYYLFQGNSGDYHTEPGWGYTGKILLAEQFKSMAVSVGPSFHVQTIRTPFSTITQTDVGIAGSVSIPLGAASTGDTAP